MDGLTSVVGKKGIGRAVGILAVALLIMAGLAPRADADTHIFETVIHVDTVLWGTEGDIVPLALEEVPEEFFGQLCEVKAVSENQTSVHPGNNLIVRSGSSVVVLEDVEGESQLKIVEGSGQLVLGSTITVELEFGPDAVFSAGPN